MTALLIGNNSTRAKGKRGEQRAAKILEELGFAKPDLKDYDRLPYGIGNASDINVRRWGQKYAINVKTTQGGTFVVTWRNLQRLVKYKKAGFKPAFLFLRRDGYYLFSFDADFPQNVRKRKGKMTLENSI